MRKLILLSFAFLFFSCGNEPKILEPENLMSKEQMVEVLYDLGLAEAAYRGRHHTDTLAEEKVRQRVMYDFTEHGVSKLQFEDSYDYYMKKPDELIEIYNEVLARYSTRIAEVEEEVK